MKIDGVLEPEWGMILVYQDAASNVIGVGLHGQDLVAAEKYVDNGVKVRVGIVAKRGPDASPCYQEGRKVVFWAKGGAELAMGEDRDSAVLLEPTLTVLALFPRGRENEPLSPSLLGHLEPPPGHLLVQRLETPIQRGRIIYPEGISAAKRSAEAHVWAVAPDAGTRFKVGDTVFLSAAASKDFPLDRRHDCVLTVLTPKMIHGRVKDVSPAPIERGFDLAAQLADAQEALDIGEKWDEGDRRAPR